MDGLVYEISEELIEELCISESADLLALNSKIKNAYREVKRIRSYPDEYSDEMIEKDMERYYSNIRNLALYDYNQIGAEGESSHNDNTGTRTWVQRSTYLEGVVAICTVV